MDFLRLGTVTGHPDQITTKTKNAVYVANVIVRNEKEIQRCYIKKLNIESIAKEYLIAELATRYNLSAATPVIVLWGENLCFGSYDQDSPSLAMVVKDHQKGNNPAQTSEKLTWFNEWKQLELATAFDELISNPDRNQQNLLLKGKNKVILIDHEGAFSEDETTPTNINILLNAIMHSLPKGDELSKRRLLNSINKEISKLTFHVIPDIINTLSKEGFIPISEKQDLEQYLKVRLHNTSLFIEMQLNLNQIGFNYSA